MVDAEDFWPEIESIEDPGSPVVLLRKQAEKLALKTGHRLRGQVSTSSGAFHFAAHVELGMPLDEEMGFTHSFRIEVPALDDYSYTLFTVSHGIESYPVIYQDDNQQWHALANSEALTDWLRETLTSEKTKRVLKTLLDQAGDASRSNPFDRR